MKKLSKKSALYLSIGIVTIALVVWFIVFLCLRPPKEYRQAIKFMEISKYENAIDKLQLIDSEKGVWYDSAIVKIDQCFLLLLATDSLDWERSMMFIEKEIDGNRAFKRTVKNGLIAYSNEMLRQDKLSLLMDRIKTYEGELTKLLDETVVQKMAEPIIKTILPGKWVCINGGVKNNEIIFEKDEDLYIAKNLKNNGSGWTKGKIMYKVSTYNKGGYWNCETRIFQYNYYYDDYSREYFGKNKLFIISKDTININYLGTSTKFVRIIEEPVAVVAE